MKLLTLLVEATIIARLNRFAVAVEVAGRREVAHLPNSGRLEELLAPGTLALLAECRRPGRKTAFDLAMVRYPTPDNLVSVDARLPSALAEEALRAGELAPFRCYPSVRREVRFGGSRLDFSLEGEGGSCLLETKSITWVVDGCALFPDAPTERGQRHLRTLIEGRRAGRRAAVVFVIQRCDAYGFSPCRPADPAFAATLVDAAAEGVEVYAYRCEVREDGMRILAPVPVGL